MIRIFLSGIIAFLTLLSSAQSSDDAFRTAPLFIDQRGKVSDNFVDPDYSPTNPTEIIYGVGTSFLPGKVYLKNGDVLDGLLKYSTSGRKLVYKPLKQVGGSGKRIKADKSLGFTIQKDTFTVIQNFEVIKKRSEYALSDKVKLIEYDNPEFAEVLGKGNDCSIVKFIDITGNGSKVNIYYLLLNEKDNTIQDVSKENDNWNQDINLYMQLINVFLNRKIQSTENISEKLVLTKKEKMTKSYGFLSI